MQERRCSWEEKDNSSHFAILVVRHSHLRQETDIGFYFLSRTLSTLFIAKKANRRTFFRTKKIYINDMIEISSLNTLTGRDEPSSCSCCEKQVSLMFSFFFPICGVDLQGEEAELACRDAVLVDEAAGEVAAKDGAEVILRDLLLSWLAHLSPYSNCRSQNVPAA